MSSTALPLLRVTEIGEYIRHHSCERRFRLEIDHRKLATLRLAPISGVGPLREVTFVHYVGKCDRCGAFHVRCQTCGDMLHTPTDDDADYGHRCSCAPPWFWLASIEEDEHGSPSAELHVIRLPGGEIGTVDRRPLR